VFGKDTMEAMVEELPEKELSSNAPGSTEVAMRVGAVAACLLGAGATWWLGGNGLFIAAVGGIAAAMTLPHLRNPIVRATPSSREPHRHPATLEVGTGETSVAKTEPARGGPARAANSEDSEVSDATLGDLTPISEILPGGKRPVRKLRP
jgi:hypothetical protein